MRRFLLIGHTAHSAPGFSHKDLGGTGGRIDILARAIPAACLVSHGLRENVELYLLHLGPPAAPKVVRVRTSDLMHANPDERSSALLLEKALAAPTTGPVWQTSTPGISVAKLDLPALLEELDAPVVLLDEAGDADPSAAPEGALFVLGDHLGFTDDEDALLRKLAVARVCLGPVSLQADQCLVVLNNQLDRATGSSDA